MKEELLEKLRPITEEDFRREERNSERYLYCNGGIYD